VSTGFDMPFGTYEEARAMIGIQTPVRFGRVDVNRAMILQYAALIHDGNASYWDEDYARAQWGATIAPPGMLMTWLIPLEWEPGAAVPVPLLMGRVPLPGDTIVNASNEVEYFLPVRVGDRLSVTEELTEVSPEKRTSLGTGHFVTTVSTFRRQDGSVVARQTNVLFRFQSGSDPKEG
jgi:acyl dehydratase